MRISRTLWRYWWREAFSKGLKVAKSPRAAAIARFSARSLELWQCGRLNEDAVNEAQHNAEELARVCLPRADMARLTELNAPAFAGGSKGTATKVERAISVGRIRSSIASARSERIFTFIDLVEILFVKTFIDRGVSMRTIRLVQSEAAEEFEVRHPSASRSSKRTVRPSSNDFNRDGREHLLDRKRRQFVNVTVFNPLIKKLDYDRVSREAMRWWPMGKNTPIVVDPKHALRRTERCERGAVTTATLFASFRANKSAEMVADWFGSRLTRCAPPCASSSPMYGGEGCVTYFFDENISHRHANMLRALREDVVHISKARGFRRSEPDTVWMPKVAAEGWIAVTLDVSIQRIAVERLVRAKSGLRVVFLAEGFRNKSFFEQANSW